MESVSESNAKEINVNVDNKLISKPPNRNVVYCGASVGRTSPVVLTGEPRVTGWSSPEVESVGMPGLLSAAKINYLYQFPLGEKVTYVAR